MRCQKLAAYFCLFAAIAFAACEHKESAFGDSRSTETSVTQSFDSSTAEAESNTSNEVEDEESIQTSGYDEDGDGCHDSYSGACIPVDEGEIDCEQVGAENIDVVGEDTYNLDADSDGVACEPFIAFDEDGDGCHDSYVGVCVPVDEGEIDCEQIGVEDIDVIGEDSFNLDADYDGVGCEPFTSDEDPDFE